MTAPVFVSLGAAGAATIAWAGMFLPPRRGIWPRTWVAAAFLTVVAVLGLAALDRLGSTIGPVNATEVAVGLVVGGGWLTATHVGYRILHWLFPGFGDQVRDLYRLGERDTTRRMVGPIVAMGVAEELVFRGVIQGALGLPVAVAAYTAVQLFERKWALCVAALLSGTVWGLLFAWRDGLVAPIVAHLLWTGMLTFVWTLQAPADRSDHSGAQTSLSGWNWDQANQNAS